MKRWWPYPVLAALCFAYRLPPLLHAEELLNSDTAVVGLQALHLRQGGWLLWGTDYQGVIDVVVTAALRVFTDRPALALVLCAVLAQLTLVLAFFRAARPALPAPLLLATTALVMFPPLVLNGYSYEPPRMWAYALVFVAIAIAEGAAEARDRRRRWAGFAAAGAVVAIAYYADLFVLVLLPGLVVYGACHAAQLPKDERPRAIGAALLGFLAFSIQRFLLRMGGVGAGELHFGYLKGQWRLFLRCVPGLFGLEAYAPEDRLLRVLGWVGSISAVALVVAGGATGVIGAIRWFRARPAALAREHRLALCGATWILAAIAGFLFTRRAYDLGGVRYLNPFFLALPLVATSALRLLWRTRWRGAGIAALATAVLHFSLSGWLSYRFDFAGGGLTGGAGGPSADEQALFQELARRGVTTAFAGYWNAYRLTLLSNEQLIVAPTEFDRYPPYRDRALLAKPGVVLFHPRDPQQQPGAWEERFRAAGTPFQRLQIGAFTALITPEPIAPPPRD